jgi:hypothetical protein
MPCYLDKLSIDFLFDKARRLIKISEIRQIIEENKKDFELSIATWKKNTEENNKDPSEEKTDESFFKTGVMGKYNYMNKYPHSKKFMDDYNKKYFSKADTFEIKLNKNKKLFKSRNIPLSIIEKHNKIEKLKLMLNNLLEKNDIIEKKEIERLSREFMTNDYREKFQHLNNPMNDADLIKKLHNLILNPNTSKIRNGKLLLMYRNYPKGTFYGNKKIINNNALIDSQLKKLENTRYKKIVLKLNQTMQKVKEIKKELDDELIINKKKL